MINLVFITEDYFIENSDFEEMLDQLDLNKQQSRRYLYLNIKYKGNNILIPLRNNYPNDLKLGYPVPSATRPNAGLDYRKTLIVNDDSYIEHPTEQTLSSRQLNTIIGDYSEIEKAAIEYIDTYVKAAEKNRERRNYEHKFSTLHNFHNELGVVKRK